ncbi:hypothetical protein Z517_08209 [Fonsecaea pedrosoi CBS 271.37]|uniref:Xylanolytic transcriptional activator regulatory domain-containing protein n=1 Tax=Fonsecaea pedrosoi CBS 271.37 TaxID=1442368 RepID=A0A0D2H119_9EURO|nr:uncharacterized protein Z517_08209 [Fonsecaea pedrosoi CBS 271.37]KIW78374.1 hypothetical protein Z517_08209 [Fonsecaea pedrosoi CBS 271.37]
MPLNLAPEWLALEETLGFRPLVTGNTIKQIRENISNMTKNAPLPKNEPSLNIELIQKLCLHAQVPFVSVEYRLAPEHPWPASLEDCVAAGKWAISHFSNSSASHNAVPELLLCGVSAGAQLALSSAIALHSQNVSIRGVIALAPVVVAEKAVPPDMLHSYKSMEENKDGAIIDKAVLDIFMDANGHEPYDSTFSVLLSPSLATLPRTYLVTCGADSQICLHQVPTIGLCNVLHKPVFYAGYDTHILLSITDGERPGAPVSGPGARAADVWHSVEITTRLDTIEQLLKSLSEKMESESDRLLDSHSGKAMSESSRTGNSQVESSSRISTTGTYTGLPANGNGSTSSALTGAMESTAGQTDFLRLAPLPVLLETVDIYFTFCHNQPYSFFHEGNFRDRLSRGEIPDHLLFAVFSNAIRFSGNSFFEHTKEQAATTHANRSWNLIVETCFAANQKADIRTVQTITLLAIFDFTAGPSRHGAAWVKIGMAVRIAQDLRFMIEPGNHIPFDEAEERRRTFWSLYLLDRLVSCGRGRPPAILNASCQLQLPVDEATWRDRQWKETSKLEQLSNGAHLNPAQHSPFAHVILIAYILGRAAQYMLQEFGVNRHPPWDSSSEFAAIGSDLSYLETQMEMHKPLEAMLGPYRNSAGVVDQANAGPIVFARALFHLCNCLLNHPFLLRRKIASCNRVASGRFLSRAFESGLDSAKGLIGLLQDARKAGCISHTSFYGYCAIISGTIFIMNAHAATGDVQVRCFELLQETTSFIEDISRYWQNVATMALALDVFAAQTYLLSELASDKPEIQILSPADTEMLWSLVDYSTLSNGNIAQQTANESPDDSFWFNNNSSWYDLFSSPSVAQLGFVSQSESVAFTTVPGTDTSTTEDNRFDATQTTDQC